MVDAIEPLVLLAEDDDAAAQLIVTNLKREGVTNVRRFPNGQEALDFINSVDGIESVILFLDIRMPVMDGMQLLKTLKSDSKNKNIPVIMLTTSDNPAEVQECYDLGCNFYVKKPVEYGMFKAVIKQLAQFTQICMFPKKVM